jgi:hypothetical protein
LKFLVSFKTPDAVKYALRFAGLPRDEDGVLDKNSQEYQQCMQLANQFVHHGEYLTVEFDTEADTAAVVMVHKRIK